MCACVCACIHTHTQGKFEALEEEMRLTQDANNSNIAMLTDLLEETQSELEHYKSSKTAGREIYIHIYVCMCINIYMYVCIYVFLHRNIYTYVCVCIHIYTQIRMCVRIYLCIHV